MTTTASSTDLRYSKVCHIMNAHGKKVKSSILRGVAAGIIGRFQMGGGGEGGVGVFLGIFSGSLRHCAARFSEP